MVREITRPGEAEIVYLKEKSEILKFFENKNFFILSKNFDENFGSENFKIFRSRKSQPPKLEMRRNYLMYKLFFYVLRLRKFVKAKLELISHL